MNTAPKIILVRPQLAENIGSIARVMSNFALSELRIVSPRDGWPPEQIAFDVATRGADILQNAPVYSSVKDAIADCEVVYATASYKRYMNKPFISSKSIPNKNAITGVLFGCEKSGLTNDDLNMANAIIEIPTSAFNNSLNIAQAVAIIAYEFFERTSPSEAQEIAKKEEVEHLYNYLIAELENHNFFKSKEMKPTMVQNIRNIFSKAELSTQEVKTLFGIFKSLKVKHNDRYEP